ncbi:adenosylcobinamide-GDP ribazoletransferase [uncultured Veillonella sp.]|uniref:adenosylcobinamide-GDP ribazoletransferase n=1 Tax=uncultured Veillonella sp. TaxID=159268 RepID=UPI0025EBDA0E|nr:adenosylcobinamide-GDP ribazoletransferase [uncultured Veillonella sp.]MDY3974390.1 adenosylcobinamide-GDP ribazoletransferase [Veillonella caviae]
MNAFFVGLQFLTRLKLVNQTEWNIEDFGKSVVFFPLIGAVIGLFLMAIWFVFSSFLPLSLVALGIVVFEFLFTGGLHADGFMDSCDGLFSGRDKERKLAIMKDSRVGSNGVVGFVFLVLLKWQLLANVPSQFIYELLFIMPVLSRYGLTMSIRLFPYARPEGMGKAFAIYSPKSTLWWATLVALLPAIYGHWHYVLILGLMIGLNLLLNRFIVTQIEGVTGDTYGFVIEVSEVIFLMISLALISLHSFNFL